MVTVTHTYTFGACGSTRKIRQQSIHWLNIDPASIQSISNIHSDGGGRQRSGKWVRCGGCQQQRRRRQPGPASSSIHSSRSRLRYPRGRAPAAGAAPPSHRAGPAHHRATTTSALARATDVARLGHARRGAPASADDAPLPLVRQRRRGGGGRRAGWFPAAVRVGATALLTAQAVTVIFARRR